MPRTVITGGAGFLGSHLCERLLADGHEVVALDNFLTGTPRNVEHLMEHDGFRLIKADVTEYVHVPGPVDQVLHFASPASPIDYLELPIETMKVGSIGTLHTLGLAKEKGARFLIASTSETYGDPQVHPQPETYWGHVNPGRPPRGLRRGQALRRGPHHGLPPPPPGRHRDRADLQHLRPPHAPQRRPRHPDLRPPGPGRRAAHRRRRRQPDPQRLLRRRPVEGLLRLLRSTLAGPVNIGNPHEMSMLELAERIIRLTDSPSTVEFIARPTDDPTVRQPDITLAKAELGWEPQIDLDDGLQRTIAWFRSHPELGH
jgi:dTDP-glucose 4,6-dehydratase